MSGTSISSIILGDEVQFIKNNIMNKELKFNIFIKTGSLNLDLNYNK